ncbi:MAG: hypothetical protein AVDCRST_MAG53-1135, partial [uncultured Solirubrobacteraceae bacterium]
EPRRRPAGLGRPATTRGARPAGGALLGARQPRPRLGGPVRRRRGRAGRRSARGHRGGHGLGHARRQLGCQARDPPPASGRTTRSAV